MLIEWIKQFYNWSFSGTDRIGIARLGLFVALMSTEQHCFGLYARFTYDIVFQ